MIRKIIQIAIGPAPRPKEDDDTIYALCDDGTLWCKFTINGDWISIDNLDADTTDD